MSNAKQKLKIGIIGCGGIANQKHMPALAKLSDLAEMTAFCDVVEERAQLAAQEFGAENAAVYTDYQELLLDESIDVVHVLTPNLQHSFITVAALEAGKHVMCEKPMAINSKEAKEMLEAADRTGKKLTIGYQNRFREDSQVLYQASKEGEFGDIYMAKAHAIRRRAVPTWGVFLDVEQQGGGPLIDIGTHALDLTLWCMDNYTPKSVTGSVYHKLADKSEGNLFGPWDPETFKVEDSAFGFIQMENGATIILECAWALNTTDVREAMTSLAGTEGGAEMKASPSGQYGTSELVFNSTKYGKFIETKPATGGGIAYFDSGAEAPEVSEARQWLECVIHDTEPLVKPEQAYVVTQILEAIYQSAKTGKTIEFSKDGDLLTVN
ncbi:Gfo/Idh/MocA family oxidoreductase [Domibacillus sp. A3M-37]|uniref:Gfo/Idh/MocA family protein n=1 Tax=Domibacillus sp. A3M-37 TaxID=2962037 RepID=UPI0020B6BC19|nr:Gfo/Idh/MocA family oxidoreductase [Domibacillus sp. A3M-37]MCP3764803.1 Gfo/Idh/MocA family oxidoreductase [Domibacillus sp. A3M-37]